MKTPPGSKTWKTGETGETGIRRAVVFNPAWFVQTTPILCLLCFSCFLCLLCLLCLTRLRVWGCFSKTHPSRANKKRVRCSYPYRSIDSKLKVDVKTLPVTRDRFVQVLDISGLVMDKCPLVDSELRFYGRSAAVHF